MSPFHPKQGDWRRIADALQAYTVSELDSLASVAGTEKGKRKDDRISGLCVALEGRRLERLVARLTSQQKAAVGMAAYSHDGRLSTQGFRQRLGVEPDFGEKERFWSGYARPSLLCLFIHGDRIPEDLRQRLRAIVPALDPPAIPTVEDPPEEVSAIIPAYTATNCRAEPVTRRLPVFRADRSAAAEIELGDLLRLVEAQALSLTPRTGEPTAAASKAVEKILASGGDFLDLITRPKIAAHAEKDVDLGPIRTFAWPRLLGWAGLARPHEGHLVLSADGRSALSAPPAETIHHLWKSYVATDTFEEVRRISAVFGASSGEPGFTPRPARRKAITAAMADCPEGRWVLLDRFLDHVRMSGRDFEVASAPWALRVESHDCRKVEINHLGSESCWNVLQARVVMCLLFEYAATLGLVDVAYTSPVQARADIHQVTAHEQLSRYDGLVGFRLTALGGYCLGIRRRAPERVMMAAVGFRVTPDLRIRVAGDPASADRLVLDTCAVAADSGSWRLDRTRILEGVASGRPVARVREFLGRRTGAALPAKVEAFLAECEARARAVSRAGQARLLECFDRGTADEIASDPRTAKHCLRAGDRTLAVPAESEAAFTRALRNVGYGIRGEERGDVVS